MVASHMDDNQDLFAQAAFEKLREQAPLAARMRPRSLNDIVGQQHLLGVAGPLRRLIESDRLSSVILWGPPGTGKTTIAEVIATVTKREFVRLSAVTSGVKDVREVLEAARARLGEHHRRTIVFGGDQDRHPGDGRCISPIGRLHASLRSPAWKSITVLPVAGHCRLRVYMSMRLRCSSAVCLNQLRQVQLPMAASTIFLRVTDVLQHRISSLLCLNRPSAFESCVGPTGTCCQPTRCKYDVRANIGVAGQSKSSLTGVHVSTLSLRQLEQDQCSGEAFVLATARAFQKVVPGWRRHESGRSKEGRDPLCCSVEPSRWISIEKN